MKRSATTAGTVAGLTAAVLAAVAFGPSQVGAVPGASAPVVPAGPAAAAAPALGPPSSAITNAITDAIAEEMDRAMAHLELPGAPKPYHISYKITEVEVNDAVASLGSVTHHQVRHFLNLECRVRVKLGDLDNGNFVVAADDDIDGTAGTNLPIESSARIARRAAWLVTDEAYKEALMQLRARMDARTAGGVGMASLPTWTEEKPVVSETPVLVPPLEDIDTIANRAANLSGVVRGLPDIRDSRVAISTYLERRWYLTSDGTSTNDTRRAAGIAIVVHGQAADGQDLSEYFTRYGHTVADLPTDADLTAQTKELASRMTALVKAPVIERYTGPVLFEGQGAADIVRDSLASNLDGTPVPEGLRPQDARQFGGGLTDRIGLKITAPMLSIVDDPTISDVGGKPVIGGYKIDDEGIPGQRVQVVKDGVLTELLTTRTPAKAGATSNGHARRTAPGGSFHGSATNLIVTAKGGLPAAKLEARFLAEVKKAGLPYGLIIRQLDDAAATAAPEMTRRELLQLLQNTDPDLPPPALVAYRLKPGGKEELVRGVQLGEVPVKAWKDVIAAGTTPTTFNFLASGDSWVEQKLRGVDAGVVPSSGIESSVTTPDLLFQELDVVPSTAGLRALPLVPAPSTK
ncbi:MAG TPA: metallopeptidase TldD-related protein [Kofleriaceae bacterium]|nr:metallopeptidase TldD-related protein [Kofleriaceae bacterium]